MSRGDRWTALRADGLEWEQHPRARWWSILVEVDAALLPGLGAARAVLGRLPVILHPDHYLHVTLRELGPVRPDDVALDDVAAAVAACRGWQAEVAGLFTFPTAAWSDPDRDGRFHALHDATLGPFGTPPEQPFGGEHVNHLTLGYASADSDVDVVRSVLEPCRDLKLGTIEVHRAVLAELLLDRPYPRWAVSREFPLG